MPLLLYDASISNTFVRVFQAVSIPGFDGRGLSAVRKFESNQLAANTPNEDRHSAATCLQACSVHLYTYSGHILYNDGFTYSVLQACVRNV